MTTDRASYFHKTGRAYESQGKIFGYVPQRQGICCGMDRGDRHGLVCVCDLLHVGSAEPDHLVNQCVGQHCRRTVSLLLCADGAEPAPCAPCAHGQRADERAAVVGVEPAHLDRAALFRQGDFGVAVHAGVFQAVFGVLLGGHAALHQKDRLFAHGRQDKKHVGDVPHGKLDLPVSVGLLLGTE